MADRSEEIRKRYWNLLHDTLDAIEGGFRRPRADFKPPPKGDAAGGAVETGVPADVPPAPAPLVPAEDLLREIAGEVAACTKCGLHAGRNNTVPGTGVVGPLVMCIGEAPGAEEDRTGNPFVGPAGQYLDKWLHALGLSRDTNAFIGNIIKCRPPGNRDPHPEEMNACLPYLKRQIEIIRPKTILTLGRISSQMLSGSPKGIGALRGETFRFMGVPCIPTYHPSGVLRNPEYRKPVWEDLQRLKELFAHA